MSGSITKFGGANLPSVQALASALRQVRVVSGDDRLRLKLDKKGFFTYGPEEIEVEPGSKWAVNPFSFVHGYIAWGASEVLAETVVPMTDPRPEPGETPKGAKNGWELCVGVALACISGEDKGVNVLYQTNSDGGKRAIQGLALAVAAQSDRDPKRIVPVITFDVESYKHKEWGSVNKPILNVVDWLTMDGPADEQDAVEATDEEPTDEQLVEAVEDTAVRRRPSRTAAAAEPAPEPEEETPAPAATERRRRRPAA